MLVAVCADKGSPGVTTASMVLAAVWPRQVVMVELDPAGGDVAILAKLESGAPVAASPGLVGLAAASRIRSNDPALVEEHTQTLRGGVRTVPGLTVAEQTAGMTALWPPLTQAFRTASVDVIADLGRINTNSPVMGVATAAEVLVVVVTPTLAGVLHARERISRLSEALTDASGRRPLVVPLVVTRERVASADVREVNRVLHGTQAGVQPACYLADDPTGVSRLLTGEPVSGRLRRTSLIRSARVVADQIATTISTVQPVTS